MLHNVLWGVTFGMEVGLLVLLLARKMYPEHRAFLGYILLVLLQSALLYVTYRVWGFNSILSWRIAWSTQGLVLFARALAVMEVCYQLLARFGGIWALAWRLLFATAALVLIYSLFVSKWDLALVVLNADRGMELSIAAVIVVLLLFARYYEVVPDPLTRLLALGFCLYSCFFVINDSILEHWLDRYLGLWNFLSALASLASVLLWFWAFWKHQTEARRDEMLVSGGVYRTLSPEVNQQLRLLNDRLRNFWYPEVRRP